MASRSFHQWIFFIKFLFGIFHVTWSSSMYDPYRWHLSYGKPTTQSSTSGTRVASIATDGVFNHYENQYNYSETLVSSQPYVQIDLGQSLLVNSLQINRPIFSDKHSDIPKFEISVGDDANIGSTANKVCYFGVSKLKRASCDLEGRYVTVRTTYVDAQLRFCELAVFKRPVENIAYKKNTASSSYAGRSFLSSHAVDMREHTTFATDHEFRPWFRVDLSDSYLVHEVLLQSRAECCNTDRLHNFDLRVGDSIEDDGNSNPLCAHDTIYTGEFRSFYCDMFGRYVNILRPPLYVGNRQLYIGQVIVNPETTAPQGNSETCFSRSNWNFFLGRSNGENTSVRDEKQSTESSVGPKNVHDIKLETKKYFDNVAGLVTTYTNTKKLKTYGGLAVTDMHYEKCYIPQALDQTKHVWIILGADYAIYMIHMVNNPGYLDHLVDFQILVGMSNLLSKATLCLPGLQSMAGIHAASFYCEPRITGNHVFIQQKRKDKQMSLCEVGVFEETKPKIVDLRSDRAKWAEEGKDLTLNCGDVKGYPTPVITWVKDHEVLQSASSTLLLNKGKSDQSGIYECWANNTHGFDARRFDVIFSKANNQLQVQLSKSAYTVLPVQRSCLVKCSSWVSQGDELKCSQKRGAQRVCVSPKEIKYQGNDDSPAVIQLEGKEWYKFFDPQTMKELEFHDATLQIHVSSCLVWMNGRHPKVQDGVVSRTLCIRNGTSYCSATIEILVRRCASHYAYNFKNLDSTAGLTFCFRNLLDIHGGFHPIIASPVRKHALSEKTFQTEKLVTDAHNCLMICQLEQRCKSFNYSKKLKMCELNSATKKELPGNYGYSADYDYYHMGGGVVKVARREL